VSVFQLLWFSVWKLKVERGNSVSRDFQRAQVSKHFHNGKLVLREWHWTERKQPLHSGTAGASRHRSVQNVANLWKLGRPWKSDASPVRQVSGWGLQISDQKVQRRHSNGLRNVDLRTDWKLTTHWNRRWRFFFRLRRRSLRRQSRHWWNLLIDSLCR